MRRLERADEKSEKSRRGQDSPVDHESEPEALRWAVRWVNNSKLINRLQDRSLDHLFRC
jgi:hypothetical protein